MGQTCSTVQTTVDRVNMLGLGSEDNSVGEKVRKVNEQYREQLRQRLKKITYIENTQELIYQWNQGGEQIVKHIKIQTWPGIQISIASIIRSNILLVKQTTPTKAYKFITLNQCKTLEPHDLIHPSLAFHISQQLSSLPQLSQSLIHSQHIYLNPAISPSEPFTFIQQSQAFENPPVTLQVLSSYMKKNGICWQDREFLGLAQMCFSKMKQMQDCGRFACEQVLVDRNGEIYVMGGSIGFDLSQQGSENKIKQLTMLDTTWLLIYLIQSLYSIKLESHFLLHTSQLEQLVEHQQSLSKFKHPSTISFLQQIYLNPIKYLSSQPKLSDLTFSLQYSSIRHYVDSYMSKLTLPLSLQIAEDYIQLNQLFKAKQVFFQLLGLSLYNQKHSPSKQPSKTNLINKLLHKAHTSKHQIQHSFQILHKIIQLQRKISHYSSEQTQLQTLTNEYVTLSLILSSNLRKSSDYANSLNILQQTLRFIEEQSNSWQLHLHIAQVQFYLNNITEAESHFCQSLKIEVNEANVCCMVMFYCAVMNWEKAAGMIRDYESLIDKDEVYQLVVAKGCLVRGLAMTTRVKDSEEKRVQTFYQAINIGKRVLDRKNVAQIVLCEVYEVIGDAHFYLRQFDKAQKNYEKSLAIASSLEYRAKQPQNPPMPFQASNLQNGNSIYNSRLSYSLSYNRTASIQSRYENSLRKPPQQPNQTFTLDSFLELQELHTQTSFVYQFRMLFNFDKIAILLTSIANCHFGQNNFSEALKTYEQASKSLSSHNVDLKNSILGNMALCYVQQGKGMAEDNKKNINNIQNGKITQGKQLLQHIIEKTSKQTPQKLNSDINYMFLAHELNSI